MGAAFIGTPGIDEHKRLQNEVDDLLVKLERTVSAAYHALLEMSAWLGIPEAKRKSYIDNAMTNVEYCARTDLRKHDEAQWERAAKDLITEAKFYRAEWEKVKVQLGESQAKTYSYLLECEQHYNVIVKLKKELGR